MTSNHFLQRFSPPAKLGKVYSPIEGLKVCHDAAKGMIYLHSADIIHRDLKSSNIMISKGMRGKVRDYGGSREVDTKAPMTSRGTALWMAPEVMKNGRYNTKADVYSFAVVLYEVCKRELPYKEMGLSAVELAAKIGSDGLTPNVESEWHPSLKSLLHACFHANPSARPTFSAVERQLKDLIVDMAGVGSGILRIWLLFEEDASHSPFLSIYRHRAKRTLSVTQAQPTPSVKFHSGVWSRLKQNG